MNKYFGLQKLKEASQDLKFWLLLFFIVRLIGITNPPLEVGHNWRQSFTNMVARNFYEGTANILYPTIDMAGANVGVVASEFPIFNYMIYLASCLFGINHWAGRLINLIFSTIGIYFFYKILSSFRKERFAFVSSLLLLCSIWFSFSRKIMPDTFSVSLVIIGIYYGIRFFKKNQYYDLCAYFIFCSLGVLAKIPALYLVGFATIPIFSPSIAFKQKVAFSVATAGIIASMFTWYFIWVPHLLQTYHNQLYYPKGLLEGLREIVPFWQQLLEKFYFTAFHSYIITPFVLYGIYQCFKAKKVKYFNVGISISLGIFFIFILKTGAVFPTHNYYIIPLVPLLAYFTAEGLQHVKFVNINWVIMVIAVESVLNQNHDFFLKESEKKVANLTSIANKHTNREDLVAINGDGNPQELYFCNRKGWISKNELIDDPNYLKMLIQLGCKYLIINRSTYNKPLNYKSEYTDEQYILYKLE
jgi:hypothetical protein